MFLQHYRRGTGGRFLERQTFVLALSAVALCAIFGDGRLDLAIASFAYDDALRAFPLANDWLLKNVLHDAARIVSATAALTLCAIAAAARLMRPGSRAHVYREELLFAALAALTATVVVGALKHFSAHACPWDLEMFGGTAAYRPLFDAKPAEPIAQGCLPAAHPLSGYAWLAAGFSLLPHAPRLARHAWRLAFLLGTLFGAVQVARGAHFPSHVLWAAWITWAVDVALLAALTRLPSAGRSATSARGLRYQRELERPGLQRRGPSGGAR